ncbi:MAG TPA: AEC family transporter [Spongiibacteraceae bacterium]|nr:AEC family transporter [Spongiibacteraceae bacterium]
MQNFIVIAVFLALGALSKRLFALPEKAPLYINQFIINCALPAVILLKLPQLTLDKNALLPMLAPWSLALVLSIGIVFLARRLKWPRELLGAVLILSIYGNSSYFGFPMVRAFFGDTGMPYAIVFDQLGNFIMLATGAPLLLAHFGGGERPVSALAMVKRVFSFPPFYALLAGVALNGVVYPALLQQVLSWFGLLLAPLAMFIVGLQFSWHVPAQWRRPLFVVLAARLFVSPALALLVFALTGHRELAARVTVFEAGMPTMVTAAIMAIDTNLAPRLCTAAVGFGLIFSLLTLPLWYVLANWLLI